MPSLRPCSSYRFRPLLALVFAAGGASAHLPLPNQAVRFQSALLRREKPFQTSGSVKAVGQTLSYQLNWSGPGNYQVSIDGIPPGFYGSGYGPKTWSLMRSGGACIIKADTQFFSCPGFGPWAALELSGEPDEASQTLYLNEFLSLDETTFVESDSRKPVNSQRVNFVVGRNAQSPMAVLEIRGPKASENQGLVFPLVHFDQTFLAPLLMRLKRDGELFTIAAQSDLNVDRDQPRFSYVLSNALGITGTNGRNVRFERKLPVEWKTAKALGRLPQNAADVSSLQDTLSLDGQFLLNSFLLTH